LRNTFFALAALAALTLTMTAPAFATSSSVGGTIDVGSLTVGTVEIDRATRGEFEYGNAAGATVAHTDRPHFEELDVDTFSVNFGEFDVDFGRPEIVGIQGGAAGVHLPDIGCIVCD